MNNNRLESKANNIGDIVSELIGEIENLESDIDSRDREIEELKSTIEDL